MNIVNHRAWYYMLGLNVLCVNNMARSLSSKGDEPKCAIIKSLSAFNPIVRRDKVV